MTSRVLARAAVCGVFALLVPSSMRADSTTVCDDPPGGRVVCEEPQLGLCKVEHGKMVEASCKTPPRNASSGRELQRWILKQVVGDVEFMGSDPGERYATIFRNRRWAEGGTVVTFTPPKRYGDTVPADEGTEVASSWQLRKRSPGQR